MVHEVQNQLTLAYSTTPEDAISHGEMLTPCGMNKRQFEEHGVVYFIQTSPDRMAGVISILECDRTGPFDPFFTLQRATVHTYRCDRVANSQDYLRHIFAISFGINAFVGAAIKMAIRSVCMVLDAQRHR